MKKDLLGLKDMTAAEIEEILNLAAEMKKILKQGVKKTPHMQGKSVVTLFYENSTRTRMSFETAAKFMSASTSNIAVANSSVQKGETLIDTGKTLDSLMTDIIVLRHSVGGALQLLARNVRARVINAGDGFNEHPTQALLDMFTLRERFGTLKLKVAIIGDIKHSRVARSNFWGLTKMGAEVRVCAPGTLLPMGIEALPVKTYATPREAAKGADAVMALRIQLERQQGGLFPSPQEYHAFYGIDRELLKVCDKNAVILHPGPINRGVEIASDVADAENSLIGEQVFSGIAVRMAVLFMLK